MAERSLSQLLQEQIESQEETNSAVQSLNKQLLDHFKFLRRQRLPSEETRRENNRKNKEISGGSESIGSSAGGVKGLLGGFLKSPFTLAGLGIGALAAGPLAFIIKPLRLISRLLIRGGPLGIAIGLLYTVFKDIGENEKFMSTLNSIKENFNNLKEKFIDIKDKIVKIIDENNLIALAISGVQSIFSNLKDSVQNILVDTVTEVFGVIDNIIEGIVNLLNGDFKGAWENVKGIIQNVTNIFDSIATNIAVFFGADFGPNGTFLTFIQSKITSLYTSLQVTWNNVFDSVLNLSTEVFNEVKDRGKELKDSFVNFVSNTVQTIKDLIPDPVDLTRSLVDKVKNIAPNWLRDWLAENEPYIIQGPGGTQDFSSTGMERGRGANSFTESGNPSLRSAIVTRSDQTRLAELITTIQRSRDMDGPNNRPLNINNNYNSTNISGGGSIPSLTPNLVDVDRSFQDKNNMINGGRSEVFSITGS